MPQTQKNFLCADNLKSICFKCTVKKLRPETCSRLEKILKEKISPSQFLSSKYIIEICIFSIVIYFDAIA